MNWKPTKLVHVGIDPGVHVGFALAYAGKIIQLQTLTFWEAVAELEALAEGAQLHVYIEDPNANRPTFWKKGATTAAAIQKVSQNVGANKRDAQLLIEKALLLGVKLTTVPPRSSKLASPGFQQLSGYTLKSSQHARDAAMLILGR